MSYSDHETMTVSNLGNEIKRYEEYLSKPEFALKPSADIPLEDLKMVRRAVDERNMINLHFLTLLNDTLFEKLSINCNQSQNPAIALTCNQEKLQKLKILLKKLTELTEETRNLTKSIQENQEQLLEYTLAKQKLEPESLAKQATEIQSDQNKTPLPAEKERDKALGLSKILLATLKTSRIQSEENFKKLQQSADILFHILYKVEDHYLPADPESQQQH